MFFVDPAGDDSGPGTIERPFATLERARSAAAPGTVVNLRAGTHRLTEPFRLSAADSGVVYQAYGHGTAGQERVVISGGRRITGWRQGDDGVYRAETPGLATRQLYVSGRRAVRASIALDHHLTRTETGYVIDDPAPQSWQGEVEFVYRGAYPWSEARCQASRISGDERSTTITMAQPAFGWAARLYQSVITWEGPGAGESNGTDAPTSAENSPAFLTEGTFALSGGVLHYLPLPGEDFDDVVAPMLEMLLHARDVHDVAFRGITFAEATWLRPSTAEGFLHYHGNGYYDGGPLQTVTFAEGQGQVVIPGDSAAMPGNVIFENASRVTLEGCRFTRLGAVALEFRGDGADNVLRGSVVDEVSGGGVVIGSGARRHRLENNHIHHVGRDYHGSPAILLSGTRDTVVSHNQVNDVPHAGIVVYEGRGAQVLNNLVHDTMQVLADGGGIYLSGSQGTSHAGGALVRGNVVRDTITPYNFGLYTDYGAAWVTVQGNVVHRADAPVVLNVSPPLEHVAFIGNFWDADPGNPPEGVTLSGNTTLSEKAFGDDPTVADIVACAGLGDPHQVY
ncbi:right-handed parallel beta-helix repeat-containing protein [Streptosporangium sp. NPDC000396]|uniref:right-handed parallel beta-helix repeat-containing protein n=1 Tax=Streptosporangium sp. NPDC000396 TaxID=3366185 RepID=UPI0036A8E124